jgi:hypothetical protein
MNSDRDVAMAERLLDADGLAVPVRALFQQVRMATVRVGALRAPSVRVPSAALASDIQPKSPRITAASLVEGLR